MEKHSKVEFHVFVKEQKLLNHKFMILTANERAFYYSYQLDFSTFLLVLESIFYRWIHAMSIDYYSAFWFFKAIFSCICCFLNFFLHQNAKKVSSTRKRNYCAFSRCAFAKLKIFHSAEKFLKWTPPLKGTCKIRQCKKCRKKWTMYCIKSVQDCVFVLLINPNGIHTKI